MAKNIFSMDSSQRYQNYISLASTNDFGALTAFYLSVFGGTKAEAEAYVKIALEAGKTYVYHISQSPAYIVSALTVIPAGNGCKYGAFGGTIPSLRCRGIFSDILNYVRNTEAKDSGLIFTNPSKKFAELLEKRGFTHKAYALKCFLKGDLQSKTRFIHGTYGGATYYFLRQSTLGDDGISSDGFSLIYDYYLSRGNQIARVAEGYLAFSVNDEEKGTYIIDECALNTSSILKLPPAFKACLVPETREEELKKANIPYIRQCTAVADFNVNGRYINGLFK